MTEAHSSKQMAADIVQVIDVDVIGNQHATLDAPDKGFDIIFYSNILEYVLFGNGISESIFSINSGFPNLCPYNSRFECFSVKSETRKV